MASARLVLVSALAFVAGCASSSPPASVPSVVPAASGEADAAECASLDLRSPSGTVLDLSGIWIGNDFGRYGLRQYGACLFWLGQSAYPGEDLGEDWTNVFSGTVNPDFTITGRAGDVPSYPGLPDEAFGFGLLDLGIDFAGSGADEYPILKEASGATGFGWIRLVPEAALSPATLHGTLGGDFDYLLLTGCIWIESGGQRYEMFGDGGWSIRSDANIRIEDDRGQVLARVGDPIRITGLAGPGLGTGCVENAILVQELDPTP